ncbi:hypothetical protein DPEC_G00054320 [Dallia pectoralis]|uniref:Uncharacterized protein n=1 Tax=Dallia pectoralis TaxID=75939 RepID=A0ACC2H5T8_DALPE|nr:hypothetical protein DPEC_G00054320 [Dallia pectoralis]
MAESREPSQFELISETYITNFEGHDVILHCHLSPETSAVTMTIRWFKETECIYLYQNGQVTERSGYEGRLSLNAQEMEKGNVSLRMKHIKQSDGGVYICQVVYGAQKEEAAVGLGTRGGAIKYLQRETQEDKLKRKKSAGELDLKLEEKIVRQPIIKRILDDKESKLQEVKKSLRESEEKIKEKDSTLEEVKKTLRESEEKIKEKDSTLEEVKKTLRESEEKIKEKDSTLEEVKKTLRESKEKIKEKDSTLEEVKKTLRESKEKIKEKDSTLEEVSKGLKDTESRLEKTTKQLDENIKHLKEKETQLETLGTDLKDKNIQVENFRVLLQEKDLQLEDRNHRLEEKEKLLEERERELKERRQEIEEKDKLLEKSEKQLKERDKQVEDVNSENDKLAQQIYDVKTEVERQRRETSAQMTVGGETSDTDTSSTVRRRNSLELIPPSMGGESSSPESPVSPSGSELRLVLLGRTGAGRRAVGNTILGTEEFGTQTSTSAVTQRSVRREGEVCGRRLVLVDTPDWFCPGLSLEEIRQDVERCVRLSAPGPHAFLLVIPVESSKEERGVLERMEEMFGEGCWGHTMIIFTHDDSLKEQSIEEFLQAGSQDLQQLVEKCGSRYQVLNIKDRTHDTQVPELLEKVEEMMAGNREDFYCSQTYLEADAQVREMERKIQKEREERKQREETEMRERFDQGLQESLQKIEGVIQEHEGDIRTLNDRTTELERQVKEERDEEKKRELERELKRESERREEMEIKLKRVKEKRENEKKEMEEKHKQEIEEIMEKYEGEARVEAERNLMKMVLPEIQRNIMTSQTKMKIEFSRQMEEKDRQMEEKYRQMEEKEIKEKDGEIERLRQNLKEINDANLFLEERPVGEGRGPRSLIGALCWVRRNSSSWLIHNLI